MKNLEHAIQSYIDSNEPVPNMDRLTEAARLDIDAASADGYRQGVEDAKSLGFLRLANSSIQIAKKYGGRIRHARNQAEVSRLENHVFREVGNYEMFAKAVFGSARGVKRAEIRQRLERMEKSNG